MAPIYPSRVKHDLGHSYGYRKKKLKNSQFNPFGVLACPSRRSSKEKGFAQLLVSSLGHVFNKLKARLSHAGF